MTDVQNKVPHSDVEQGSGCTSVSPFRDTTQPARFSPDRSAARYAKDRRRTADALHICLRNDWRTMMYKESALQVCTPKRCRLRQSHSDLFSDTDHQSYLTQSHANGWKTEKLSLKTRNMTLEKRNPQENSDRGINFAKMGKLHVAYYNKCRVRTQKSPLSWIFKQKNEFVLKRPMFRGHSLNNGLGHNKKKRFPGLCPENLSKNGNHLLSHPSGQYHRRRRA